MKRAFVPPRPKLQVAEKDSKVSQQDNLEPEHVPAATAPVPPPAKRRFQTPGCTTSMPLKMTVPKGLGESSSAAPGASKDAAATHNTAGQYYTVLYTKRAANKVRLITLPEGTCSPLLCHQRYANVQLVQKKKNKSYIDGVLEVKEGDACVLYDEVCL